MFVVESIDGEPVLYIKDSTLVLNVEPSVGGLVSKANVMYYIWHDAFLQTLEAENHEPLQPYQFVRLMRMPVAMMRQMLDHGVFSENKVHIKLSS